ncbi:hypothetical protein ACTVKE_14730 [Serratia marcescens]|uniref:hypothetical protein n=1 Tax=Serratia marcescens TaxID=615 RepID=UPI003FA6E8FC
MTTIKRFTPDYKMHAVRFEAFAREAEHGEYVKFDAHQRAVSALEAERDAQQKRADALAVENAALKANLMFWDADNPELPYDCPEEIANECELNYNDEFEVQVAARLPNRKYRVCESWEYECKLELVEGSDIETPATDAALAAIQAQGVEKLIKLKMEQLASMHPDTHAFGATAESLRAQINELQAFATELREAK